MEDLWKMWSSMDHKSGHQEVGLVLLVKGVKFLLEGPISFFFFLLLFEMTPVTAAVPAIVT